MSVGHDIIQAIARGGMFGVHDGDGPVDHPVVIVWSSGAAEQLEAVVQQHINGLIESHIMVVDAYAACSAKLNDALVEVEKLRALK